MSGYFNHLSSNAHFANIQADQGFIGDAAGTSSDHGSSGMVDFALQLGELSLEEKILKEFTLFQSKNMDLLQETATACPSTNPSLRQSRIQGWWTPDASYTFCAHRAHMVATFLLKHVCKTAYD